MVSAAPMVVYVLKGHDFSRAINSPKMARASAPEGSLLYEFIPFEGIGKLPQLEAI
jgi:hypothetical protein